ncbi:MAG: hypothetical protein WCC84_01075 [Candidatus Cybelea sp.]
MKTISGVPYALSVCAATVLLAGCGGSAQLPNPVAQTPLGNTGTVDRSTSPSIVSSNHPNSGGGKVERLTAPRVHNGSCGGNGFEEWCGFHARGTAAGPYPGTFFARSELREYWSSCAYWTFEEKFIITSGASKTVGTIDASGCGGSISIPGVYQYTTTNGYSGSVKIQSLGGNLGPDADFREIFHGM